MKVSKKKGIKFDQTSYDLLFHNIENNLRELGFGDVSVNKKMKDYVNLFYAILEKIETWEILDKNKKIEMITLCLCGLYGSLSLKIWVDWSSS